VHLVLLFIIYFNAHELIYIWFCYYPELLFVLVNITTGSFSPIIPPLVIEVHYQDRLVNSQEYVC